MYIVNPLQKKGMKLSDLSSTHPPISERIKILRSMSSGASLKDYSQAFQKVSSSKMPLVSQSALKSSEDVSLRAASAVSAASARTQTRSVGDIMRKVSNYKFISCECGLKMKLPSNFKGPNVMSAMQTSFFYRMIQRFALKMSFALSRNFSSPPMEYFSSRVFLR